MCALLPNVRGNERRTAPIRSLETFRCYCERLELSDLRELSTLSMYIRSGSGQVDRAIVLVVGKEVRTLDCPSVHSRVWVGVVLVGNAVFALEELC